jgi:hypothetical protein
VVEGKDINQTLVWKNTTKCVLKEYISDIIVKLRMD